MPRPGAGALPGRAFPAGPGAGSSSGRGVTAGSRGRRRARATRCPKTSNDGIRLSGLRCWVSAIQPAMLPTLLGRMPAPRDTRPPTWVRSGPSWPLAGCRGWCGRCRSRSPGTAHAPGEELFLRNRRGTRFPLEPRLEIRRRHRHRVERHQRVRPAAVLGALAPKHPGRLGLDHHAVDAAGDHVGLAGEVRDPEAVDHVPRAQRHLDRLAGGQPHLVRADHRLIGAGRKVPHLPPPLVTDHLDAQSIAGNGAGSRASRKL